MTMAKQSMDTGPAIQPSWAVLHARESTPEPMTAVMMCATQVHIVPDPVVSPWLDRGQKTRISITEAGKKEMEGSGYRFFSGGRRRRRKQQQLFRGTLRLPLLSAVEAVTALAAQTRGRGRLACQRWLQRVSCASFNDLIISFIDVEIPTIVLHHFIYILFMMWTRYDLWKFLRINWHVLCTYMLA